MKAFLYRSWCLTRRNFLWFAAWAIYQAALGATVVLIGKAVDSEALSISLLVGSLVWTHLNVLLDDISHNITFERWEDTLEFTLSAPVERWVHLVGVALYAFARATFITLFVFTILMGMISVPIGIDTVARIMLVVIEASFAFFGLGMLLAVFPLTSSEHGPQAATIAQGLVMMVSGINYPITVLPEWVQPFSKISPATYALEACRRLAGVRLDGQGFALSAPATLADVLPQLQALAVIAVFLIPLGLAVFCQMEHWAKRTGSLKRSG